MVRPLIDLVYPELAEAPAPPAPPQAPKPTRAEQVLFLARRLIREMV